MSLLSTHGLDAFYGDFQALYGVNVALEEGQCVALIGPNGAGKTTLLRALMGWVPVAEGMVLFDGHQIGGASPDRTVAMGIASVPEGRRLFPSLTVDENLIMGRESGRRGAWTLDGIYDLFPSLRGRRGHLGSGLSGGQQQMVAIGRALMANPRVLLVDELSLGLAPTVVNDIARALPRIRETGVSIMLVEQDVRRALSLSDYAYCILEGRINLQGPSGELEFGDIEKSFFGEAA
ncbi:ABC transporter ATP-binding protein [Frigidibacter sp. SD6-1]|uniref:ABC transporter ATP-binding protein n=1 Tax=Frigidibacter sp. SD6-1 TaxID=3032581 RepID=UPI0024DFBC86|nr:ABC transporter ATP-binding protein [Frigidibacter sp. SD6-1]